VERSSCHAYIKEKCDIASVANYRPVFLLNNFSRVFEFVVYEHMSRCFKHTLNPIQPCFSEAKSTTTDLLTYLDFILSYSVLNVKFILFILTLALHLTLSCILFYFTNCGRFLTVT
jgi:hypothetical protein